MCDFDFDAEERCDAWVVTVHRARVPRWCWCCRMPIFAGESYQRVFSIYDRSPSVEEACLSCSYDVTVFGEAHRFTPSHSTFYEYLSECIRGGDDGERWRPVMERLEARIEVARRLKVGFCDRIEVTA